MIELVITGQISKNGHIQDRNKHLQHYRRGARRSFDQFQQASWQPIHLETVVQAELNLARRRTHTADLAKAGVSDSVVRVSVAGDVEDVEKVSAEAYDMLAPNMEIFEQRSIHLAITGRAFGAVAGVTESERGCAAVCTNAVVDTPG